MRKKGAVLAALCVVIFGSVCTVNAYTTKVDWNEDGTKTVDYTYVFGGIHCVNDENDTIDFKVDKEYFFDFAEKLKTGYMPDLEDDTTKSFFGTDKKQRKTDYSYLHEGWEEKFGNGYSGFDDDAILALGLTDIKGVKDREFSTYKQAVDYLIQNDIWTPPGTVTWDPSQQKVSFERLKYDIDSIETGSWQKAGKKFLKSDLVMMMDKISYGVQLSKPLVWTAGSQMRSSAQSKVTFYQKEGTLDAVTIPGAYGHYRDVNGDEYFYNANAMYGDLYVYWSPNVYELYINHAVSAGLVDAPKSIDELKLQQKDQKIEKLQSEITELVKEKNQKLKDANNDQADSIRKSYADRIKEKNRAIKSIKKQIKSLDPMTSIRARKSSGMVIADSREALAGTVALGKTVSVTATQFIESKPKFYGSEETMTLIEALQIIETFMRANEGDMSQAEEEMIRYKLGLSMLDGFRSDEQRTLTYLIAKGVLDYTNVNIAGDLYKDVRYGNLLPVIYRVANKDARLDFSVVQLTDSDKQWQSEGFYEQAISVIEYVNEPYFPKAELNDEGIELEDDREKDDRYNGASNQYEIKEELPEASADNGESIVDDGDSTEELFGFSTIVEKITNFFSAEVVNAADFDTVSSGKGNAKLRYTVTKLVDYGTRDLEGTNLYLYNGVLLEDLEANTDGAADEAEKLHGLKSIEKSVAEVNGKEIDVWKMEFEFVSKDDASAACLAVDKSFQLERRGNASVINGVTKVTYTTSDGESKSVSMVSQDSLQKFGHITALEDKVLMNTETGVTAYFSSDQNFALIGNSIITSDYKVITSVGGKTYYNLEALQSLLPSAYIMKIGSVTALMYKDAQSESSIRYSTSLTDSEDYDRRAYYVRAFDVKIPKADDNCLATGTLQILQKDEKLSGRYKNRTVYRMLKLNSVASGISTLTKHFDVEMPAGVPVSVKSTRLKGTVIVEWQYVVPNLEEFDTGDWLTENLNSKNLTYQDVAKFLTTSPMDLAKEGLLSYRDVSENDPVETAEGRNIGSLHDWWESNYGMSNALCNFMYGTKGLTYVSSGYLVPSVTVLLDLDGEEFSSVDRGESTVVRDTILKSVFQGGVLLGNEYLQYNDGNQDNFWKNYYCYYDVSHSRPGLENSSADKLAKETRHFRVYSATVSDTGKDSAGTSYGCRYFVSASGAVYQNLEIDDSRFLSEHGKDGFLSNLKIITRFESVNLTVPRNSTVNHNGNVMLYYGMNNGSIQLSAKNIVENGEASMYTVKGSVAVNSNGKSEFVTKYNGKVYKSSFGSEKNNSLFALWKKAEADFLGVQEDEVVDVLGKDVLDSIKSMGNQAILAPYSSNMVNGK